MEKKQIVCSLLLFVILFFSFSVLTSADTPFPFTKYSKVTDAEGTNWYYFGDQGGGVYCEKDGVWTEFTVENSGLEDDRIENIYIDINNVAWFEYVRESYIRAITSFDGVEWKTHYEYFYIVEADIDDYGRMHLYAVLDAFERWIYYDTYYDGTTWNATARGWGEYYSSDELDTSNPFGAYESEIPETDYFPLSVGSKWVYKRKMDDLEDIVTVEIAGTRELEGETYAIFRDGRAYRQDSSGNIYQYKYGSRKIAFDMTPCYGDSCEPYVIVEGNFGEGFFRYTFSQDIQNEHYEGYVFSSDYGTVIGLDNIYLSPNVGMVCFRQFNDFTPGETWELVEADIVRKPAVVETKPTHEGIKILGTYPNPFNPETTITFSISDAGPVTFDFYNISGQRVYHRQIPFLSQGIHRIIWDGRAEDGSAASSGVYLFSISSGNTVASGKVVRFK